MVVLVASDILVTSSKNCVAFSVAETAQLARHADSADEIYRHAKEGGFPADLVSEIKNTFGPDTADAGA